jgi:hypothetical protein
MMSNRVCTPQAFAQLLISACANKEKRVNVYDLWAVPDYQSWIAPFIHRKFGRYAKGKWTQLQITFEAVDVCDEYPLAVKVSE